MITVVMVSCLTLHLCVEASWLQQQQQQTLQLTTGRRRCFCSSRANLADSHQAAASAEGCRRQRRWNCNTVQEGFIRILDAGEPRKVHGDASTAMLDQEDPCPKCPDAPRRLSSRHSSRYLEWAVMRHMPWATVCPEGGPLGPADTNGNEHCDNLCCKRVPGENVAYGRTAARHEVT